MEMGAHPAALPWRVINSITSWAGGGISAQGLDPEERTERGGVRPVISSASLYTVPC